jgi:RNA polymerase sigma-70 factor (ECF subfamily)
LRDVLGLSASEVAAQLDVTVAAVNSALQRARARLPADHDNVAELAEARQRELLERYVAAFENADVAGLVAVLAEDAMFEMPPFLTWFRGRAAIGGFLGARMRELGKASVVRTSANGQPAVALYTGSRDGKRRMHSLHVLTVAAHGVSRVVAFQDIAGVRRFDLPASRS